MLEIETTIDKNQTKDQSTNQHIYTYTMDIFS